MNNKDDHKVLPLKEYVRKVLDEYLVELDGTDPASLYQLVIEQVEHPLLEMVLNHAKGNRSKAANMLGLSRGTLRQKLKYYQLDD